jgi:hypothetical protein
MVGHHIFGGPHALLNQEPNRCSDIFTRDFLFTKARAELASQSCQSFCRNDPDYMKQPGSEFGDMNAKGTSPARS